MAGQGQGPQGVIGSVPDLGALRDRQRGGQPQQIQEALSGEPAGFYANDVQPTVQAEGNITLTFRQGAMIQDQHAGPVRLMSDPVRVTLPAALFMQLIGMAPTLVEEAKNAMLRQGNSLDAYLKRGLAQAQAAAQERQQQRGPGPGPDQPPQAPRAG